MPLRVTRRLKPAPTNCLSKLGKVAGAVPLVLLLNAVQIQDAHKEISRRDRLPVEMNVSSTFRPVNSLNISLTLATSSKENLFSSAVNRMARLIALDAASHSGLGICTRLASIGFRKNIMLHQKARAG